jgi:hypothetical protein
MIDLIKLNAVIEIGALLLGDIYAHNYRLVRCI